MRSLLLSHLLLVGCGKVVVETRLVPPDHAATAIVFIQPSDAPTIAHVIDVSDGAPKLVIEDFESEDAELTTIFYSCLPDVLQLRTGEIALGDIGLGLPLDFSEAFVSQISGNTASMWTQTEKLPSWATDGLLRLGVGAEFACRFRTPRMSLRVVQIPEIASRWSFLVPLPGGTALAATHGGRFYEISAAGHQEVALSTSTPHLAGAHADGTLYLFGDGRLVSGPVDGPFTELAAVDPEATRARLAVDRGTVLLLTDAGRIHSFEGGEYRLENEHPASSSAPDDLILTGDIAFHPVTGSALIATFARWDIRGFGNIPQPAPPRLFRRTDLGLPVAIRLPPGEVGERFATAIGSDEADFFVGESRGNLFQAMADDFSLAGGLAPSETPVTQVKMIDGRLFAAGGRGFAEIFDPIASHCELENRVLDDYVFVAPLSDGAAVLLVDSIAGGSSYYVVAEVAAVPLSASCGL